jgi:hypothetical protein
MCLCRDGGEMVNDPSQFVIASAAKQSMHLRAALWIASSLRFSQ